MMKRFRSLSRFSKQNDLDSKVFKTDEYSPEVDKLIELQSMVSGGQVAPLFHMAGGGPLFITSEVAEPLALSMATRGRGRREAEPTQPKSPTPKDVASNWVTGDYNEVEAKLGAANKAYSDAILRYAGDANQAMNDPYVKAAFAAAQPDAYMVDKLNRRREMFDRYKESIFQTGNLKGDNLDIDEIEKYHGQTGKVAPITVGQSFRMYEDTPTSQLHPDQIGSTWNQAGKVVFGKQDMDAELNRIFEPAKTAMTGSKIDIPMGLEQIVSPLGDKVYEHFKTVTKDDKSNETALRAAATAITSSLKSTSPGFEKYLKEQYLRTHVTDDGQLKYYYDNKGNETEDFQNWKKQYVEREIRDRINQQHDRGVSYSGGRYEDWDAGSGKVKDKIGPWENVIKDYNIGAENLYVNFGTPNPNGSVTAKDALVKTYKLTDEHRSDLNQYLGKKVADFTGTGGVMGAGGAMMRMGSNLDLGVITSIEGNFYKLPKIVYDAQGNPAQPDPKNHEIGTYVKAMVALTEDDIKNHPELGDYITVAGTNKMQFMPYDVGHAKEKGFDVSSSYGGPGGNLAQPHTQYGAQDVTNSDFWNSAVPSGATKDGKAVTYADLFQHKESDWTFNLFNKDVIMVPVYIPVNDAWVTEEKRKGTGLPGSNLSITDRETASKSLRTIGNKQ